jgi:hypothetical protein
MRSLFRLLLLWLMVLALPVQGFAAAAGQHCATMHERMQLTGSPHHEAADAAHPHAGVDAAHAHAEAPAHDPADATAQGGLTCSACAACCAAVGLPANAPGLPAPPHGGVQPQALESAATAFLTGGLERPPRTVLA